MSPTDTVKRYDTKFCVAYLEVTPFKDISTKSQLCKYQGGLILNIRAFVSIHPSTKLQDLIQAVKVAKVIKEDMIKTMKGRDGDSSRKGFTPNRSFNKIEGKKEALLSKSRGTPKEFKGKS